jgi:hypothetical protein
MYKQVPYLLPTTYYLLCSSSGTRLLFSPTHIISVTDLINQFDPFSLLSYLHLPTFSSHNQILLIFSPIKDQTSHQSLRSMSLLISTLSYTHYLSPSTATPHRLVTSSHRPIPSRQ